MRVDLRQLRWITAALATVGGVALALQIGERKNGPDAATYIQNSEAFTSLSAILDEQAFEQNYWQAGYSGFLRLFAGLGEYWLPSVRIAQVLMVVSLAFMAYYLTKHLSEKIATLTFIVVALSPNLLWFALVITYEVLLGWLITAAITLLWRLNYVRRAKTVSLLAGLAFGVALFVQFKSIVLLPILVWLAWRAHRRAAVWLSLGVLAPISLWMLRNYVVLGTPAPWSRNGSVNVWLGNRPDSTGGYPMYQSTQFPPTDQYLSEALNFALEAVRPFLELQLRKGIRFWYPNVPIDFHLSLPRVIDWLLVLFFFIYALVVVALFCLFLASLLWRVRSGLTSLTPLALGVLLMFLVNMPFIVDPRYRIPVEALVLAICVPTLAQLVRRWTICPPAWVSQEHLRGHEEK